MTKNTVISEISLVLVPANIFLVPANIFLQKKHWVHLWGSFMGSNHHHAKQMLYCYKSLKLYKNTIKFNANPWNVKPPKIHIWLWP